VTVSAANPNASIGTQGQDDPGETNTSDFHDPSDPAAASLDNQVVTTNTAAEASDSIVPAQVLAMPGAVVVPTGTDQAQANDMPQPATSSSARFASNAPAIDPRQANQSATSTVSDPGTTLTSGDTSAVSSLSTSSSPLEGTSQSASEHRPTADTSTVTTPSAVNGSPSATTTAILLSPQFSTINDGAPQLVGAANQTAPVSISSVPQGSGPASAATLQAVWNDEQLGLYDAAEPLSAHPADTNDVASSDGVEVPRPLDSVFAEIGADTHGTLVLP
jgi:hypothetical protein